jgi:exopolysaccharide biosynthesis protein
MKERPLRGHKHSKALHQKVVVYSPQNYIDQLSTEKIADGVIYKTLKGPLTINLLDIDLTNPTVKVRPIMAGDAFNQLKDVSDHVKQSHALAAVNANYFKKDGTPLGTLIVDGEWVAGPLYDRVSLGITKKGFGRVDRVKLGGQLATSNTEVPNIWINNINQPRRTGSRLVAYTRRWGSFIRLPYEGCCVALDATGRVVDKSLQSLTIPYGGMVLTDSTGGPVSKLRVGDRTYMTWQTAPSAWSDVVEAVSGGPLLIKDGDLYVDLKDERFRAGWTSASIHARTAAAVTANNHLLLATVEGAHTLWDLAKFLQKMGAKEALNLDGGGSTTMVVKGEAVTRAPKSAERRVASSIGVFVGEPAPHHYSTYQIHDDISQFVKDDEGGNVEELSTSNLATHSTITH